MSANKTTYVLAVLLVVAVVCIGVLLKQRGCNGNGNGGKIRPHSVGKLSAEGEKAMNDAYDLESERKWCEAKQAWEKVLKALPEDSSEGLRAEVKNHEQQMTSKCTKAGKETSVIEDASGFPSEKPMLISQDKLKDFYRENRVVHSMTHFDIQGKGTNRHWIILRSEANFVYRYKQLTETKVSSNDGTIVIFEQYFPDAIQVSAASERSLELDPPDSPIVGQTWKQLETNVLHKLPHYVVVKAITNVIEAVDPNLKQMLTGLNEFLIRSGIRIEPDDPQVAVLTRLDELSGLKVRIKYVSGLGVTKIEVLEGKTVDADVLKRLAVNSNVLMDYFLSQGEDKPEGTMFTLKTSDVSGLINPGYDVEMGGSLDFKVAQKTKFDGDEVRKLDLIGGQVDVTSREMQLDQNGTLTPLTGFVEYSPAKHIVRRSKASWKATTNWISKDHLLFETKGMKAVRVNTYYEADVVKVGHDKAPMP